LKEELKTTQARQPKTLAGKLLQQVQSDYQQGNNTNTVNNTIMRPKFDVGSRYSTETPDLILKRPEGASKGVRQSYEGGRRSEMGPPAEDVDKSFKMQYQNSKWNLIANKHQKSNSEDDSQSDISNTPVKRPIAIVKP
jgi:hypothetical protein